MLPVSVALSCDVVPLEFSISTDATVDSEFISNFVNGNGTSVKI